MKFRSEDPSLGVTVQFATRTAAEKAAIDATWAQTTIGAVPIDVTWAATITIATNATRGPILAILDEIY